MQPSDYRGEFRVYTEDENFFYSIRAQEVFGKMKVEPPQEGCTRKLETLYRLHLPEMEALVKRFQEAANLFVEKIGTKKPTLTRGLYTACLTISENLEEMPPSWMKYEEVTQNFAGIVPTDIYVKDIGSISKSFTMDYGGPPGDIPYRAFEYRWTSMLPEHVGKALLLLQTPQTIDRIFSYFKHYFG